MDETTRQTVDPDPARFVELVGQVPAETPVTMLNLLRFREVAQYADGSDGISGRDAYLRRYARASLEHVTRVGGEVVWSGEAHASLIGPADEEWDLVLLVRYPSIGAFVSMVMDPEYQQVAEHRTAALADSRLVATVEASLA